MMNGVPKRKYVQGIILIAAVLLIGCLSISAHSLWMDEGLRIGFSNVDVENGYFIRSWQSMHVGLVHYMYAWGQLIGTSEVAYRAMNLPFFLVAAVYMVRMLRRMNLSAWWVLLFVAHPMTVYYMNDAGPYIALLGCACAVSYHCFFASNLNSAWNTAAVLAWLLLGFAMHFTFGFVGFLYLYSLAYRLWQGRRWGILLKDVAVAVPFMPAFAYILWMYLTYMPKGAALGMDTPGFINLATCGYCFTGMSGLGVPRNEMKAGGLQAFSPLMLTLVSTCCVALLTLLCLHVRKVWMQVKSPVFAATALVACVFFVGAVAKDFQFWERHVIFLFPAFFLVLAIMLQQAWQHRMRVLNRALAVVFMGLILTSSARLRWSEPYRKDDYKSMIHYVQEQGLLDGSMPVLAQGDFFLYHYYGVGYAEARFIMAPDCVTGVMSLPQEDLLQSVDYISRNYSKLCLILHQKKTRTPELYADAERIFAQKGYFVTCNSEFNTFKVLILERTYGFGNF